MGGYTKGPWRAVEGLHGYPDICAEDYEVVGCEGMYGVFDIDWANATLIAESPSWQNY